MSLEETVSVVGSEVMPLEYGGMDSKSSPSSSERTVEGVGGGEVVGVEGDSVPITMVEVEGRRERCYDVDADIVEEVKQYESELGTRDSMGYLVESYEIFSRVLIRPAGGRGEGVFCSSGSLDACDEEEEVGKLVREGGKLVNIMYLTNAECIEATELYGPSALSEAKMDKFLGAAGGVAIPKKPRKKSKTSTKQVDEGGVGREVVPSTLAGVEEEVPRLELKRKGREEGGALQKKKRVVEEEERGSEVPQFVLQPLPVELDPGLKEFEEGAEVRAPGKGEGLVPPLSFHGSLFEAKNMTGGQEVHQFHLPGSGQASRTGRGSEVLWGFGSEACFGGKACEYWLLKNSDLGIEIGLVNRLILPSCKLLRVC
ncbi:hypothetical protein SLEP1_g23730 [Rubroshorea leprosula]|uniref:Uncharacterized protein n=1 Tax=Rubroshorea leprosula TaxID=152421 RepID=A0AAV5JD96_9ROSI|nr:hypothetical protein SLEP1_g23730 [Rubroshorea leprosula]